jgi:hypothetical protein
MFKYIGQLRQPGHIQSRDVRAKMRLSSSPTALLGEPPVSAGGVPNVTVHTTISSTSATEDIANW